MDGIAAKCGCGADIEISKSAIEAVTLRRFDAWLEAHKGCIGEAQKAEPETP